MPVVHACFAPNDLRTTLIKISDYGGRIPEGTIYNPQFGEVSFRGTIEMLLYIDHMLDELELPKSAANLRSFTGEPGQDSLPEAKHPVTAKASFKIRVIFRQNASWQGSVAWVEGGSEAPFRSVFELLNLMDDVLSKPA
ncbi:MAG TPA: hypothetical protein VN446_06435 [Candidatus Acidoferrum sp.]|nr:hypothetical protein [Candidatus Acidoferrum sp.]